MIIPKSTEISPSSATQFLFYDLTTYYVTWFKTGTRPKITKDAIYYCHRRQIVTQDEVVRQGDIPMHDIGSTPVDNEIELLAFLTKPATLQIEIADKILQMSATLGLVSFKVPAIVGVPIFKIIRDGRTVVNLRSAWQIEAKPDAADPLYVGGCSTRPICQQTGCTP